MRITFCAIICILMYSCESEDRPKNINPIDNKQKEYVDNSKVFEFVDNSLSGMELRTPRSVEKLVGLENLAKKREFGAPIVITNESNSEIVEIISHSGGVRNAADEFKLYHAEGTKVDATRIQSIKSFRSGKGIHLGTSLKDVERALGKDYKTTKENDILILRYKVENASINHPSVLYFGEYHFKENALVKAHWGFEYP